jgi:hypothetical protein
VRRARRQGRRAPERSSAVASAHADKQHALWTPTTGLGHHVRLVAAATEIARTQRRPDLTAERAVEGAQIAGRRAEPGRKGNREQGAARGGSITCANGNRERHEKKGLENIRRAWRR